MITLASIIPSVPEGVWLIALDMKDTYISMWTFTQEFPACYSRPGILPVLSPPLWAGYSTQSNYKAFLYDCGPVDMPGLYLDDLLLVGQSHQEVRSVTSILIQLLTAPGICINEEKSLL